ncbi:MAG: hypothetical protein LBB67_02395 [Oscillospiraceae bacterium]|jgi:hypothetical protein|nr:hypothetical protein [Oscillospiraceae bacterium]
MIVRIQFAEYLQIGNTPIVGGEANKKSTWPVRFFNTAPADNGDYSDGANNNGALPTENRHIWYMTGAQKIFKPGTGEMGSYEYTDGQDFADGSKAKKTLEESPVVLVQYYLDHKAQLDGWYPEGLWALDTDGYAYWTRALQPGEATNLLLDNVVLDENVAPDDNYYYAIDVRLEASNLTESYLLYSEGKDATANGEKIIKDAVDAATPKPVVETFEVSLSGALTRSAESFDFEVTLPQSAAKQVITLTGIVTGTNLPTKVGLTTWSRAAGRNNWLQTAGNSPTVRVVIPSNDLGSIVVKAQAKDDPSKTITITIHVVDGWLMEQNNDGINAEVVNAQNYILPTEKTGDSAEWMAIARHTTVTGAEYYLIVRRGVVGTSKFDDDSNNYTDSDLKTAMDDWWEGFSGPLKDDYAVAHNALERLGTNWKHVEPFAGFSAPDTGSGFKGAFPLSVDEAAEYMSTVWNNNELVYKYENLLDKYNTSNAWTNGVALTAYTNLVALADGYPSSWLRSPSLTVNFASFLSGGRVSEEAVNRSYSVRPALWVSADIFA